MISQAGQAKLNNLVATVGSLNDELKKTNSDIESAHIERTALSASVDLLRNEKNSLSIEISTARELKNDLAKQSEDLKFEIAQRNKELKDIKSNIHAELGELKLIEEKKVRESRELKELTKDSSILSETIEKKLEELKKLDEETSGKISIINQLKESITLGEFQLQQVVNKRMSELEDSKKELKKVIDRSNSIEKKLADDQKNMNALTKNWEQKNKDLLVVQRRLREKWKKENPNMPFPKLDW